MPHGCRSQALRRHVSGLLAAVALLVPLGLRASQDLPELEVPASGLRLHAELGVGHESQQAPLFQVTPESAVIYLDGVQRLAGSHVRARAQLDWQVPLSQGRGFNLQADVQAKRATTQRSLDFYVASLQPMWHMPLAGASVGAGVNFQNTGVAGSAFRNTQAFTLHWTRPVAEGLWAVIGDWSRYRHPGQFADLDAQARSVVVQRRWEHPWTGTDGMQLSAVLGRERNRRGFAELSQRSLLLSASVDGVWRGLDWTLRASHLAARFDGVVFADQPQRSDRMAMLDASLAWPLGDRQELRLEANLLSNRSSVKLFQNRYRQWSLSWRQALH